MIKRKTRDQDRQRRNDVHREKERESGREVHREREDQREREKVGTVTTGPEGNIPGRKLSS